MDHKQHKGKTTPHTNWKPILFWAALILGIATAYIFNLNRFWIFALLMVACHMGHSMMGGGKHH